MPLISVLTPTHAPSTYIDEALAAVRTQALPTGWEWEWVVQEDGVAPRLAERFASYRKWIRYEANGAQLGVAMTRNLALSRARGELVRVLDHDDVLLPGALATAIGSFEAHDIGWTVEQADDLLPDGTREEFLPGFAFGIVPRGAVNTQAADWGGNWPVHTAGLTIRTSVLRAIGGWGASPTDDDLVMFAALSAVSDGWHDPATTWLYRQHSEQTIRTEHPKDWSEVSRRIALQRSAAVQQVQMGIRNASPGTPVTDVVVKPPVKPTINIGPTEG